MNISEIQKNYRNDIDGLRALAVILVIFFHSGSTFFPSGFIGVDIFFVISGYLITGIILNKIRKEEFSLSDFFVHRLWRIQPALIVVSLVTLAAAAVLFLPVDFIDFLKSAKYNALFLSNQYLGKMSATYASPDTNILPLLHTWSLSLEWQWYLFLPLFVLAGSLITKRLALSQNTDKNDRTLLFIWLIATAALATYSLVLTKIHPGSTYYFLSARAFEFTTGGAAFLLTRMFSSMRGPVTSLLSLFSFVILVAVSVKTGLLDIYPNGYTLVVSASAAIILFCGHYREKVLGSLLSTPPIAFIGRLSYSLYLWHWPVFAFCRYMNVSLSGVQLYLALGTIATLALSSYFLIEAPLRRRRTSLKISVLQLVLLPILLFSALYAVGTRYEGLPQRLGSQYSNQYMTLKQFSDFAKNREECLEGHQDPAECQFGDLSSNKKGLLIGDSNANHFWGFFDVLAQNAHIRMESLTSASCLTLPGVWQYDWWKYRNEPYTQCHEHTEHYYRLIKENHYDYVILGEVWENYASGSHLINNEGDERSDALTQSRMKKALQDALNNIIASGAKPVIITTVYSMPTGYMECHRSRSIARGTYSESDCDTPRPRSEDNAYTHNLFAQMKMEYPTLTLIDVKDVQCPDGRCLSEINTIPVYRDVGHITDYASYHFGQDYLKKYGNPFK